MIKYLPFIILLVTILACNDDNSNKKNAVHLDGCTAQECWIDENPNPTGECD